MAWPAWSTRCARRCAPGQKGLKVIIADGECQLARQRRIRPEHARRRWRPASAWCAPASGSTRRCAPATTPASACRAAPRSPSSRARTRCAPIPSPTSTTTASAAACAARSRTRRSCAPRSRRSTSSRTRARGTGCGGALSAALIRLLGGGRARAAARARAGGVTAWPTQSPSRLLIAALGGEGGGVLASWLHAAAIASGHFVQGTSIPGVAQRTGATTYYLEIVPGAGERHRARGARPVLALNAAPGEVDLVVASELLEATRAISAGFVTPDRTLLIASSARVFTVDEKMAMGDGRLDDAAHAGAGASASRAAPCIADFAAVAAREQEPAQRRAARAPSPPPARCRSRPRPSAPPSAPRARRWTPTCAASRRGWR